MAEQKTTTLSDFLTEEEINRAIDIYKSCHRAGGSEVSAGEFNKRCAAEIIAPALPRINKSLGQENDARYLAYVVEYVFNQANQRGWLDKVGAANDH